MVNRQAAPTGTPGYGSSTGRKRRQEMMQAACAIHGGSNSNTTPATISPWAKSLFITTFGDEGHHISN